MSKTKFLVLGFMVLGLVLRVTWLAKYPAGFTPDEAAFGYNAYSILQTGKDEWGTSWWQLFFTNMRSFGDYKLPLYTFLTIPGIKIFGLNEFSTRLPNAIIGTLAIGAIYLLTKRLSAAVILTLSPWAISMSRGAFEANLATLFLPLGIYLFLKNKYWLSVLVFALGFYSYHSARLVTPLVIISLIIYKKVNKGMLFPGILLGILLIPGLMSMVSRGSARTADVSIISPTGGWGAVADRRFEAIVVGLPDAVSRFFSNKPIYVVSAFVKNYLSYWSPQFWFTNGAGEATYGMITGRGTFYYIEIIFLIGFVILLIHKPKKEYLFILLLAALGFVPAALSKGPGYATNRAVIALPFLVVMLSFGAEFILKKKSIIILLSIIYFLSTLFFIEDYLYHAPKNSARSMNYGWIDLMPRLMPIADRFPNVRFSRSLSEPHIFVAFYNKIDPVIYQKESQSWLEFEEKGLKFLDQYDGYYLDKYRFGDLKYSEKVNEPTLYIGRPNEFPDDTSHYIKVFYPDGTPDMMVAEKQP
ncbi:glycosyltransferase family 39 protein [Candidatus Amesbacteria bacterium]|nr:glycosyltransferase family 39 protein [Candidatus Amesbacteria bacterium]